MQAVFAFLVTDELPDGSITRKTIPNRKNQEKSTV